MIDRLIREPLLVRGAVGAVIAAVIHLLVVFGLPIPDETANGLAAAVDAVIGFVVLLLARSKVTPVAAPDPIVDEVEPEFDEDEETFASAE